MSNAKDFFYEIAQRDSQNIKHLAEDWNLPWLEEEAKKNEKNPGRAIGKAATAAATWYLGGPLWESLGAAGQGANAAVPAMYEMGGQAATETAKRMAAQQLAQQAGLMGTMESAITDTGYTPSSLMNAARYGPDSGQTFGQTMGNWAGNKGMNLMHRAQNNPMGLLGGNDEARKFAMNQGLNMMQPQPMQAPPPPQRYQPPPPPPSPYGMTEEEKQRLRMMGYQVY